MSTQKPIQTLRLDGGILCLDFANTVSNRMKPENHDYLSGYKDLLVWSGHAGALSPKTINTLERLAKGYPQKAAAVFNRSIQLRELIVRVLGRAMIQKQAAAEDMQLLNTFVAEAYANIEIGWQQSEERGVLHFNAPALELVNWLLVKSLTDLYTSERLRQVKQCPACGWLFLDKSRNGSRRWCNMATCGDVNKVQQWYQRKRKDQ
ncbi:MAG TPA: CGNR zinc finger domain-containing protein [Chitinophaga sp.]|uniref:CGNR zinc finger domain-containing protein n=1 Tax=Chitinophaga sp. TaxID=1869181 RepID=UPI002CC001B6|nr:CGNR zinc finger domain-containing protein [Chitinophaga sp.]HVI46159.1 CGNR zinc finger domain-containing protein [Chitinophaga sp.]